jgi:hypothetical protein
MGSDPAGEPSDEQLIEFARDLLGGSQTGLGSTENLEATIHDARQLWLILYRINHGDYPPQT